MSALGDVALKIRRLAIPASAIGPILKDVEDYAVSVTGWSRRKIRRQLREGGDFSRYVPLAVRRAVLERDGDVCRYCGCTGANHLDHVMPWSRGGTHSVENLVVACFSCNVSKRDQTPDEWVRG